MDRYQSVFENNRRWVAQRKAGDPGFFEQLAQGQTPDFLYIGCADSRVPAAQMMGMGPGDVFVHRNVANLVVNTDANVHAVIDYAVAHLKVKHVVVCGHTSCGGVGAAMAHDDLGTLNGWLREIRDVARLHQAELNAIADDQARYDRLVELNVIEQCLNVMQTASVQHAWRTSGQPRVHGWVYDLATGLLKDLELPFEQKLAELAPLYRLS